MENQIVLIRGAQGAGKTTLAHAIAAEIRNTKRGWFPSQQIFAGTIYEIHDFARGRLIDLGIPLDPNVKIGKLLQLLGTEFGRETLGENIWVDVLRNKIEKEAEMKKGMFSKIVFIISDCRFPNEFDGFPEALRINLEASEQVRKDRIGPAWRANTSHPSEIALNGYAEKGLFDMTFRTDVMGNTAKHIATLVVAELDKNSWIEKR